MSSELTSITVLLERYRQGFDEAKGKIVARLYGEFLRRAHVRLKTHERHDLSIVTDDVTQMTVERLLKYDEIKNARNTHELFWAFARTMKEVLIDHIRRKEAIKRGGEWKRVSLDDPALDDPALGELGDAVVLSCPVYPRRREEPSEALVELNEVLERLA